MRKRDIGGVRTLGCVFALCVNLNEYRRHNSLYLLNKSVIALFLHHLIAPISPPKKCRTPIQYGAGREKNGRTEVQAAIADRAAAR